VEALAAIPESLDAAEAGRCSARNHHLHALRHSGALPSDLVAVQGIGGLGHLGIQFANKFGYQVAAIGRGPQNAALAKKLGAHVYIDSKATDAAQELQKLGGASVILATAPDSKSHVRTCRRPRPEWNSAGCRRRPGPHRGFSDPITLWAKERQGLVLRHPH